MSGSGRDASNLIVIGRIIFLSGQAIEPLH